MSQKGKDKGNKKKRYFALDKHTHTHTQTHTPQKKMSRMSSLFTPNPYCAWGPSQGNKARKKYKIQTVWRESNKSVSIFKQCNQPHSTYQRIYRLLQN